MKSKNRLLPAHLIFAFSFFFVSICAASSSENLNTRLSAHTCGSKAQSLIKELGVVQETETMVTVNPEKSQFRIPGQEAFTWLLVDIDPEKIEILLQKSAKAVAFSLNKKCVLQVADSEVSLRFLASTETNGLEDPELEKWIATQKKGLIYIWSPHMPLSIAGLDEVQKLKKQLGLSLMVLRDPNSSQKLANEILQSKNLDKSYARAALSHEVFNRNMLLHFPSWVTVQNQKIGSTVLGYRSSDIMAAQFEK